MFRSSAASVRFAEVTNTTSSSATTAFAWRTPPARRARAPRVVEDVAAATRAGPSVFQKRSANRRTSLLGGGRVAPLALDVEQQRDLSRAPRPCAAPGPRTPSGRRRTHRCWPRPSAPPSRAALRRPAACRGREGPAPRARTRRGPVAAHRWRSPRPTLRASARRGRAGDAQPLELASASRDAVGLSLGAEHSAERTAIVEYGAAEMAGLERVAQPLAQVRRQIEQAPRSRQTPERTPRPGHRGPARRARGRGSRCASRRTSRRRARSRGRRRRAASAPPCSRPARAGRRSDRSSRARPSAAPAAR